MVVHPAVQHRVDTGRAECQDATQHITELEEATEDEVMSELGDHRVSVKRSPRHGKHRHDSQQHLVCAHALLFRSPRYRTCTDITIFNTCIQEEKDDICLARKQQQ